MGEDTTLQQAMAAVLTDAAARMRQTLAERATTAGAAELVGAGNLIRDVEAWAQRIAGGAGWAAAPSAAVAGPATGTDTIIGYGLEIHPRKGPFLCEYRQGAGPFRTPRFVYDAVIAAVLRGGPQGADFNEILTRVAEQKEAPRALDPNGRPTIPDYLVRVPLRFWERLSPPLILRDRARFRAADLATFEAAAAAAWESLPTR